VPETPEELVVHRATGKAPPNDRQPRRDLGRRPTAVPEEIWRENLEIVAAALEE
jgi:hypothetical protein